MEIGDFVQSEYWGVWGIVKEIRPCINEGCSRLSFTFDEQGSGVRFYYHADQFVVIRKKGDKQLTKDQKTVIRHLGLFVGFKVALVASIMYSSRHYRKMMNDA